MPVSKNKKQNSEPVKKDNDNIIIYDVADKSTRTAKVEIKGKYATKNTLNLCMREKSSITAELFFGILAIILAVLLVVEFFGVYRPYRDIERAEAELNGKRTELAALEDATKDFDDVKAEYNKYNYENYNKDLADRLDVLDMLDVAVFPYGKVTLLSFDNNQTLMLNMEEVRLISVSDLIKQIDAQKLVNRVTLVNSGGSAESPTVNLIITLQVPAAEGGN